MQAHVVSRLGNGIDRLQSWFQEKSSWLALGVIAVALSIRVFCACSCYLNPDEAFHFGFAGKSGWFGAYKASLGLPHPPLLILLLHGMLFLGRSEPFLRSPSVIGGTAALWFTFAWIRRSLGELPALAGLGFMALSPAAISASTEVRQYGLLLFFICGSIYTLDRALVARSTHWAIVHGCFMLGALLADYSAVLVLPCLYLYSWIRMYREGLPRRFVLAVGVSQLVVTSVLGWLYFGQVRHVTPFASAASMHYLRDYYYAAAQETPLGFTWRAIKSTFEYASTPKAALPLLLVLLVGIAALIAGRIKAPRLMALLILGPFVLGFAAAVLQKYPFDGTRHQAYLVPFFAAGVAAAFALLSRRLALGLLLLGAVFAPLWFMHITIDNDWRVMPRSDMTRAIAFIHSAVSPSTPLFVDYGTLSVLGYYLSQGDNRSDAAQLAVGGAPEAKGFHSVASNGLFQLGGYDVVVPRSFKWVLRPSDVFEYVDASAHTMGRKPDDPLWVATVFRTDPPLASQLATQADCNTTQFGLISVIEMRRRNQ